MRDVPLPSEFSDLAGKVQYVQQKSRLEYSSTCPKCGGSVHPDGELPNRFVMLIRSNTTGGSLALCRKCGYKWWPGQTDGRDLDPAVMRLLEQQAQVYRQQTEEQRAAKLARFTTRELWLELNRRMEEAQRAWWRTQGIDDDWQNYLKLGYTPDKPYLSGGELLHSPAYTIPYFHQGWDFRTIQYRLTDPANPKDRYRFEADLSSTYYMVTPSEPVGDVAIVCEGAKKAIVAKILGDYPATYLAIPSSGDWQRCGILEAVKGCGRVYILLDPDTWVKPKEAGANWRPHPERFAEAVGKSARTVEIATKVDDGFLHYGLDADGFQAALRCARRLN